jgi:hypothetical protein
MFAKGWSVFGKEHAFRQRPLSPIFFRSAIARHRRTGSQVEDFDRAVHFLCNHIPFAQYYVGLLTIWNGFKVS